jgi:hypothetical protein
MWALILIIAVFACGGINAMANAGRNTTTTLTDAQIAATNSAQLAATNSAQGTTDTPVPTATLNASIPTSTPAPTQAPAKWTTTHTYTGSGSKKTGTISVPSDWKIFWKCTPSSFYGGSYNVIVEVYNSDGSLADGAINTICKTGNTGDSTEEHQGGDVYLDIQSEGDWVITVQEFK